MAKKGEGGLAGYADQQRKGGGSKKLFPTMNDLMKVSPPKVRGGGRKGI
jgi:hypothetical protein